MEKILPVFQHCTIAQAHCRSEEEGEEGSCPAWYMAPRQRCCAAEVGDACLPWHGQHDKLWFTGLSFCQGKPASALVCPLLPARLEKQLSWVVCLGRWAGSRGASDGGKDTAAVPAMEARALCSPPLRAGGLVTAVLCLQAGQNCWGCSVL